MKYNFYNNNYHKFHVLKPGLQSSVNYCKKAIKTITVLIKHVRHELHALNDKVVEEIARFVVGHTCGQFVLCIEVALCRLCALCGDSALCEWGELCG